MPVKQALASRFWRWRARAFGLAVALVLVTGCRSQPGYDDRACQDAIKDVWEHNIPLETYNLIAYLYARLDRPMPASLETLGLEQLQALCREARPSPTGLQCALRAETDAELAGCDSL